VYYYHLDHLGTPRELTDAAGKIVWSARYRAYGALALADVTEIDNPLRFQGQYWDADTGLHYNLNRYYDPQAGRFIHQDPIGLAGGVNLFQYAVNPVNWIDPLGLTGKDCSNVAKSVETDKFGNVISRLPKSIQDQMTLDAAKRGEGIVKIDNLGDPKYARMQKMELETISNGGKKSNVHYVRDPITGDIMDFKFKKHSTDYIHRYESVREAGIREKNESVM
ncbi:RHS repeat domain-containing protein, partial [Methylobacter sp. BlB1]|uniref:RHS repeat domain-containing protein n=1 Tax=Methylobacter sp. BlB1 TaxID=2785914 RepID=UPI00272E9C73